MDHLSCVFIFFAWPKKTNQKKRQPSTWSRVSSRDCPALLETVGSLKTRTPLLGTQKGQTPVSIISVVLVGVKWQNTKNILSLLSANPFRDCLLTYQYTKHA